MQRFESKNLFGFFSYGILKLNTFRGFRETDPRTEEIIAQWSVVFPKMFSNNVGFF